MSLFPCSICSVVFSKRYNRNRHMAAAHAGGGPPRSHECILCGLFYHTVAELHAHVRGHVTDPDFALLENHFRGAARTFRRRYANAATLEASVLQDVPRMARLAAGEVMRHPYVRVVLVVSVEYIKVVDDDIVGALPHHLRSSALTLTRHMDHADRIRAALAGIAQLCEDFVTNGSGWALNRVDRVDLEFAVIKSLNGGCAPATVPVPTVSYLNTLRRFQTQTGVPDQEADCFFVAVARALTKSPDLAVNRAFYRTNFDISGIPTPVALHHVRRFEDQNMARFGMQINVLFEEDGGVFPIYASKHRCERVVNLILVRDGESGRSHYLLVDDLDRLLRKEYRSGGRVDGRLTYGKRLFCPNCLHASSTSDAMKAHRELCMQHKTQRVVMPREGDQLKFINHKFRFRSPLVGYYDFECVQADPGKVCRLCPEGTVPDACPHNTKVLAEQKAVSFALLILDHRGRVVHWDSYAGPDAGDVFLQRLLALEPALAEYLQQHKPLEMSAEDEARFRAATDCHICGEAFTADDKVVRDHCHLEGHFIAAAHNLCNLQRSVVQKVTLFCHNFGSYDAHLIMQAVAKAAAERTDLDMDVLPRNTEKLRTLRINRFHFLDSYSFLSGSLAQISKALIDSGDPLPLYAATGMCVRDEQRKALLGKMAFPYEFCTSYDQMAAATSLPDRKAFFSRVSDADVSEEAYAEAQRVWDLFGCRNMVDFCLVYVRSDVILLASVMEKFRADMLHHFDLDATHFISLPQLSLNCMLKKTGVKVDFLTDPDMALLMEQSIRGGMSYVATRYAEAPGDNEAGGREDGGGDPTLCFLDVNNLYGYGQCAKQPIGDFRWLTRDEIDSRDWTVADGEADEGYIVECDLSYPSSLHADHGSLPLAPYHGTITEADLSLYSRTCLHVLKGDVKHSARKLIADFRPRKNYVVHYTTLALYAQLGMKIERVGRVIGFRQEDFLRPYIDFCSAQRAATSDPFQSNTFKLLSNSLYGKFLEDIRNRMEARIVTNREDFLKLSSSPRYHSYRALGQDVLVVHLNKATVHVRQLHAVGFTILEVSKRLVYDHFYNVMRPLLLNRCDVLGSDTDSLILRCHLGLSRTDVLRRLSSLMDFANFPPGHPLHSTARKSVPGFWKDELAPKRLTHYCGLASKTYAIKVDGHDQDAVAELRKAKGVTKCFSRKLAFADYVRCLQTMTSMRVRQYQITSRNHVIKTMSTHKIAFSSFDDKRWIMRCGIHTVPYGSWLASNDYCPFCEGRLEPR